VRPPLTELTAMQVHSIIEGLKKLDFDMPGLDRAQAKAA
jgi:hypothetical protein